MSEALPQCRAFLGAIFDPADIIEFRPLPEDKKRRPPRKRWGTLDDLPGLIDWLAALNADGHHAYFGGNPRKRAGGSEAEDVALARCLWADFDKGTTPEEAARRIAAAGLPVPTVMLTSGNGTHTWWRLSEPMTDLAEWTARTKAIIRAVGSDKTIHDAPRIMRLPGFTNHKYPTLPVAGIIDIEPSRVYSLDELAPWKQAARVAAPSPRKETLRPMSAASRAFIERGTLLPSGGRRETIFTVACDLHAHGWSEGEAESAIMPRARCLGLTEEDVADIPRQIESAFSKPRTPLGNGAGIEASNGKPPADDRPAKPKRQPVEPYTLFPTELLPEPLREFVEATAAAMRCDASYAALPLLAVVASAIGTTRQLRLKRSWSVLPILWTATIGESGTLKTPPFKAAMRALRDRQGRALEEYEKARQQHLKDYDAYEKAKAAWKKNKNTLEPSPDEPTPPVSVRYTVSDCTVESLAPILLDNPRGVLMARDELAGWFGSFDKYSGGGKAGSADAAHWLSMHNGEAITVDRKTGPHRTTYVPMAAASLTGGIQPKILCRALGQDRREDGMLARLLVTCPPRRPKRWTEDDVPERLEKAIARLLDRLHELEHETDEEERLRPGSVGMEPEAKRLWVSFYNAHADEQADMAGDLAAAWSKLEEYAPRLALVIHFTRWAAFDTTMADEWKVDAVSMRAGIELVEWFKREAKRVYSMLGEDDEARELRRLAEWIERKGGDTTAGEVAQGCRWLREAGMAADALEELRKAGWGSWVVEATATKQRSVFRLSTVSTSTDSRQTRGIGESVAVDTVDARKVEPEPAVDGDDDEWGEI